MWLALASLLLSVAPAVSAVVCASYKPMAFAELNRLSLIKGTEKGEYETTADWKKRLQAEFPSNNPIIGAAKVGAFDEKYDADRRVLTISTAGSTSRSLAGSIDLDTLILGMRFWSEPGYVGQNALGISRDISVAHYDSFLLYWPHNTNLLYDYSNSIELQIDVAGVRDLRGHLSFVVVGVPAPPYTYSEYHRSDPTISEPQESHFYERGLVVRPLCAALVDDRTWKPIVRLDPTNLGRRAR